WIELTLGYFQITATAHLAVYGPAVQFESWYSEKRITDIQQVETTAHHPGKALYWMYSESGHTSGRINGNRPERGRIRRG
ncbi:TPA: hypothetical protein ACQ74E_003594, partial [Escherichia coli]